MPIIILGGILGGVVTPTEAASVAVAYALFVGVVIYRAITIDDFIQMLIRTARVTGVIFLIIASASILGWWLAFMQIPQAIAAGFPRRLRQSECRDHRADPGPAAPRSAC